MALNSQRAFENVALSRISHSAGTSTEKSRVSHKRSLLDDNLSLSLSSRLTFGACCWLPLIVASTKLQGRVDFQNLNVLPGEKGGYRGSGQVGFW